MPQDFLAKTFPEPWRAITATTERSALIRQVVQLTEPDRLLFGHDLEVIATNGSDGLLVETDDGWLAQVKCESVAQQAAPRLTVIAMFKSLVDWSAAWQKSQRLVQETEVWRSGSPEILAEIRRGVFALVAEYTGSRRKIDDATRLYHDLNLSGDDANEFLNAVHGEFGTLFHGLRFGSYFPSEGEAPFRWLERMLKGKTMGYREFTVGHLIAVISAGAWSEPGHSGV